MTAAERILLGKSQGAARRRRVYRIAEGLEVDEVGGFELTRRRLLWKEIRLVTLHRAPATAMAWVLAGLSLFTVFLGLVLGPGGWPSYLLYTLGGLCGLAGLQQRAPRWVVTVFARRAVTHLLFRRREEKARYVYDEICRWVADAQAEAVAQAAAPLAPEVPEELIAPDRGELAGSGS